MLSLDQRINLIKARINKLSGIIWWYRDEPGEDSAKKYCDAVDESNKLCIELEQLEQEAKCQNKQTT